MRAMARSLALTLLAVFASSATAHAETSCPEPKRVVLPADGATDVPLNARAWTFEPGVIQRDHVVRSHEIHLMPDTEYTVDGASFTTGADIDNERPAPPKDVRISFFTPSSDGDEPMWLSMTATTSPDTAWIRVEIDDPSGPLAFAAERKFTTACDTGIRLAPGDVRITLRAVDLAGNTSEPVSMTTRVYAKPDRSRRSEARHVSTGENSTGIILAILVITVVSIVATGRAARRRRRARAAPGPVEVPHYGEPVSLSVAEAAIKLLRWRHVIATLVTAVLAAGGMFISAPIGFLPGIGLMGYAGQLIADSVALRNARSDRTIAWREGKVLVLRGPWGCSQLALGDKLLVEAQRAAMPTASVERRD